MHIGFLTSEYPHEKNPNRIGGIGTSIKNLVSELIRQGNKVSIFLYGQSEDIVYQEGNLSVVFIKNTKAKFFNWWFLRKKLEKVINQHVEEAQLDVIEAADWSGITAFMNIKCKVVVRLHGSDTYFCHLENRKQKQKNYILEKQALKSANAVVSVSAYTATVTKKLFDLNRNIKVIHNGLDLDVFNMTHSEKNSNEVLYFGTLNRKKGVLEIPYIVKELRKINKDFKIVLIGNDSNDPQTGRSTWSMIQELSTEGILDYIEYRGPVAYSDMRDAILKSSLCIFPSYAEAFPVSWMEAMACSKPIVTSDIGWAKELIEDEKNGLLSPPDDYVLYAQQINRILTDSTLAEHLSLGARERIEKFFSSQVIAEQNIAYYENVIKGIYQ